MGYIVNTHKRAGKIFAMDYDKLLDVPDENCLYCLSQRDVLIILAQAEYVRWKTRYLSDLGTPIDQTVIEAWYMSIQEKLMTDNCAIGGQISDLLTIVNNLTYKLTVIEDNMCVSQAMALNFYRAGVITAGQPAYPDTTFSSDTSLPDQTAVYAAANGLCQTIYRYIESVLADNLTRDSLAVGLIAGGAGIINPILGVIAAAAGGIAIADLSVAVGDQSAIDDVACCMYKALRDAAVTFENFVHSLDDCGFSFPDNNATIAGVVGDSLNDEANYLSFVATLKGETNKALASSPTAFPVCGSCSCGDTIDFTAGQRGDWEIVMGTQGANGIESLTNTDNPFSSPHSTVRLKRHIEPGCHIDTIRVYYRNTNNSEGRSTAGANYLFYTAIDTGGAACHSDYNAAGGDTSAGTMVADDAVHYMDFVETVDDVTCIVMFDTLSVWKYYITKIVINP